MKTFDPWALRRLAPLLLLLAVLLGACQPPEPKYFPVSVQEAQAYGAELEAAYRLRNHDFFKTRCDHRRLAFHGAGGRAQGSYLDNITKEIKQEFTFTDFFLSPEYGEFPYYHRLPYRQQGQDCLIQFRRTTEDGGAQYLQGRVERRKDGEDERTVMTDLKVLSLGEWISQVLFDRSEALGTKLMEEEGMDPALRARQTQVQNLYDQGKIDSAEAQYKLLPPEVRNQRSFWLLRLYALMAAESEQFIPVLKEFRSAMPGDVTATMLALIHAQDNENYIEGLQALDSLEAYLGTLDGNLCYQRSNIWFSMGNLYQAREWSEKAVALEPDIPAYQKDLLFTYLHFEAYDKAVEVCARLVEMGLKENEIGLDGFPDFLRSKAYTAWQADS